MNRYFLNGQEVTREQAVAAWHKSPTYEWLRAGGDRDRGVIFLRASRSPDAVRELRFLAEAGITIERHNPQGATTCAS